MRRSRFLMCLFVSGFMMGCTTIPADIAADYETLNKNIQVLLPKMEAHAARVEADSTASVTSHAIAKHDLALSAGTRLLSAKLSTYFMNHTNKDAVAQIQSDRIAAATPAGTGKVK